MTLKKRHLILQVSTFDLVKQKKKQRQAGLIATQLDLLVTLPFKNIINTELKGKWGVDGAVDKAHAFGVRDPGLLV